MTRTFIALEMNEHLQGHLAGVIRQVAPLLPSVRWVDAYGIHLTLAFLGELDNAQLAEAMAASQETARVAHAFTYRLARLGIFGSPRQPRVIWMGLEEPTGALIALHRSLNLALEQRGFTVDKRPFSPHFTLARVKAPLNAIELQHLQRLLNSEQQHLHPLESYPASRLIVVKSELSRAGAHYTVLQEYALSGI
jgi:2'-5' RNA ligase